ncbi:hypothetical protein QQZ08_007436 [Neonectria magnoliae]|uniref:F-box domain-containing protein n=1 Tax=Neonectria magnoliae TaxID=2732573 RepID=A0ABR1HYJ7_9HYPO
MLWSRLPTETRQQVLHLFVANSTDVDAANASAVCKEWRSAIRVAEPKIFKFVEVTPANMIWFMRQFSGSPRRRFFLRHLRLNVKLLTKGIYVLEDAAKRDFQVAVTRLFGFLRKWDYDYPSLQTHSLCLELSTCLDQESSEGFSLGPNIDVDFNPFHYDTTDHHLGPSGLPVVRVITEISVLQRNLLNISEKTLFDIFDSLPRLTRVHLEPENRNKAFQEHTEPELTSRFPILPLSVKSVHIVQHGEGFDKSNRWYRESFCGLGGAVVERSFSLEELALCDLIDAHHFFEKAWELQPNIWDNLLFLTLTSDLLLRDKPLSNEEKITEDGVVKILLEEAATVSECMPVLRVMELFNASDRSAAFFSYEAGNDSAMLAWSSTWDFVLPAATKRCWARVCQDKGLFLEVLPEVPVQDYSRADFVNSRLAARRRAHWNGRLWT